ncbi:MAG: PQQ-dependent sugar dehydrogenase [Pedobacter sp.]|nr:MAG: PQQ-dependent sugar dehydrogenase [Pedobacter sp.]
MKNLTFPIFALFITLFSCKKDNAGNEEILPVDIKTREVASGLKDVWELIYGPDNHLWITERSGKVSRVNVESGAVTLVYRVPDVVERGEGGLLGMALHPQFSTTPWVYLVYNYGDYQEKVVRYTYAGGTLTNPVVIVDQIPGGNIHNGSRLTITTDQKLLISTGDAGIAANAQNANSLSGKILRVNLDGSVPSDNPIPNNKLWSLGHRNPQGLIQANGRIYSSEHGPNNDDEINIIIKGGNFGWPNVDGYCNTAPEITFCTANNVVEPINAWTPTIATAGISFYNSDYIPQWKNSILLVTLKAAKLVQLKLNDTGDKVTSTQDYFVGDFGRLRAICQSPDGKVYLGSSKGSGDKIIELSK